MKGIGAWRTSVVATVSGVSVAVAGVLLFARSGPSGPTYVVPEAVAVTSTGPGPAAGARGPGIPPAPGGTQNAPPNPYGDAPTANLKRVANALRVGYKSVNTLVTLPAGLNLTARVDVSVLFDERGNGSQRVTQAYDDARGNRFVANVAAGSGTRRR